MDFLTSQFTASGAIEGSGKPTKGKVMGDTQRPMSYQITYNSVSTQNALWTPGTVLFVLRDEARKSNRNYGTLLLDMVQLQKLLIESAKYSIANRQVVAAASTKPGFGKAPDVGSLRDMDAIFKELELIGIMSAEETMTAEKAAGGGNNVMKRSLGSGEVYQRTAIGVIGVNVRGPGIPTPNIFCVREYIEATQCVGFLIKPLCYDQLRNDAARAQIAEVHAKMAAALKRAWEIKNSGTGVAYDEEIHGSPLRYEMVMSVIPITHDTNRVPLFATVKERRDIKGARVDERTNFKIDCMDYIIYDRDGDGNLIREPGTHHPYYTIGHGRYIDLGFLGHRTIEASTESDFFDPVADTLDYPLLAAIQRRPIMDIFVDVKDRAF
jgi:hypothetical protein